MSAAEGTPLSPPTVKGGVLESLMQEADRQLAICNACRYCEGFCAVFPALARRTETSDGDVTQLANLCHDCRACYDACMYTPPHEFGVNVPKILTEVRLEDYRRYCWPRAFPRLLSGWRGLTLIALVACAVVTALAILHAGVGGLAAAETGPQSPYRLIPYGWLLALILVPTVYAVAVMGLAGHRYWTQTGRAPGVWKTSAIFEAGRFAATLRYLKGGDEECYYPDDEQPSPGRRWLHMLVAWGFGLCLVSTVSAAVMQDISGVNPPFSWLSVPVISGLAGGICMAIGCLGLTRLKMRSSEVTGVHAMTTKDYGLLAALGFLSVSGVATLAVRSTPAFGIVFLIHLSAIVLTIAAAPYSKFVHVVFRLLALVRDSLERADESTAISMLGSPGKVAAKATGTAP